MTITDVSVGIALIIVLFVFGVYAGMAVRHATHFRYLSKRMLILTLLFATSSITLCIALVTSYVIFVMS